MGPAPDPSTTPKRREAEGEGFEPPRPQWACRFSRPVHSTRLCHPSGKGGPPRTGAYTFTRAPRDGFVGDLNLSWRGPSALTVGPARTPVSASAPASRAPYPLPSHGADPSARALATRSHPPETSVQKRGNYPRDCFFPPKTRTAVPTGQVKTPMRPISSGVRPVACHSTWTSELWTFSRAHRITRSQS